MMLMDMIQVPPPTITHSLTSTRVCASCLRDVQPAPRFVAKWRCALNVRQGELLDDELDTNMVPLRLVDLLEKGVCTDHCNRFAALFCL